MISFIEIHYNIRRYKTVPVAEIYSELKEQWTINVTYFFLTIYYHENWIFVKISQISLQIFCNSWFKLFSTPDTCSRDRIR